MHTDQTASISACIIGCLKHKQPRGANGKNRDETGGLKVNAQILVPI